MLCYFWGHWDDPIIRRLSLPTQLLLILSLVYVWPRLVGHRGRWLFAGAAAGIYLMSFAIPSMAMHRYTQENFAARTTDWLGRFIRNLDARPVIAVDNNAGLEWFLYGKSSIGPKVLAHRYAEFLYHFRRHSFADYFVVQRVGIDQKTGHEFVSADDDLGPGVHLQTIKERAFSPIYLVRLSRITAIDEGKFKTWAELTQKLEKKSAPPLSPAAPQTAENNQLLDWLKNLP